MAEEQEQFEVPVVPGHSQNDDADGNRVAAGAVFDQSPSQTSQHFGRQVTLTEFPDEVVCDIERSTFGEPVVQRGHRLGIGCGDNLDNIAD
ncbi:hypothetical protein ACFXHA_43970 [Nocardia sp. NPDC059240]|uniref:hypothetical protein n=1 Tax=Nocardia sp. NPDC059240 TaxID=3346786 RepID=UPI0036CEEA7C